MLPSNIPEEVYEVIMKYETTYKLENFVLNTGWSDLPLNVRERIKGCFVDLTGALITGSRSDQFKVGLKLAEEVFGTGNIPVIGSDRTFCFIGAAAAMGHASNAYDIDDGHNLIRAHPGTSVVGPILAAALEKNVSRDEFLTSLLMGYETTIRSGIAIMDYYSNPHSSGTFAPTGIAAGVGRLYGFSKEQLNNCISIAEFNAPLVAGSRSTEYPSMNKDGVPFGAMIGALAVKEQLAGFTGNKNLLESEKYNYLLDNLGKHYQVMDLYFKPYSCCRWAHPAIDACLILMRENRLTSEDIETVRIETFLNATRLSKIVPLTADEAQYNIAYPVAAALVYQDFGIAQVHETAIPDTDVVKMMDKLFFVEDPALTARFPAHRICRAVITTKSGESFTSPDCEPRGEACENISLEWLCEKFRRITAPVFTKEGQDSVLSMLCRDEDLPIREIVREINCPEYRIEL